MSILSVQSWVATGHVGNAAAVFPLQRLGAEVWAVNTVQFSNHPGYGDFAGEVFEPDAVAAQLDALARRGVLGEVEAVLSGYLGRAGTGQAVLDTVARLRVLRPDALFCCDPVMGDVGSGLYVRPEVAALLCGAALEAADIVTPNLFELGLLEPGLGAPDPAAPPTLARIAAAAEAVRARMRPGGFRLVLVSSVVAADTPSDAIDLLLAGTEGCAVLRTPRLPIEANGAGDLLSALFLLHVLRDRDPVRALEQAASAVWGVLRRTAEAGLREPMIVGAQDELVQPGRRFTARTLR